MSESGIAMGRVVGGRYRVDRVLGAGGMGVVARAHDTRLDRDVALKLLHPHAVGDAQVRARLLREAHAMAVFTHPSVVHVYDAGETDDGGAYLAMELVEGETVRNLIGGPWPIGDRLRVLVEVARALGAAHRAGLVHRDVKPDNLMLRADGRVALLDFGIVRIARAEAAASALTGQDMMIGTLRYMSPEQAHASSVDGRSDQFSFGVTAFEVLTDAYPWPGETPTAQLSALLTKPTPAVSSRGPVPAALDGVLARATEKDPEKRYPSMEALADAMTAATASSEAYEARTEMAPTPGVSPAALARTEAAPTPQPSVAVVPRARRLKALLIGLVVALVALSLWVGARAKRSAAPMASAAPAARVDASALSPADLADLVAGTTNPEARAAFLLGYQAWHDGDEVRAEREWERSEKLDPGYGAPHLWRAASQSQSDLIAARKVFEQATAARGSLVGPNRALYEAYSARIQKDPPDKAFAMARLEAATREWPRTAYVWAWRALVRNELEACTPRVLEDVDQALALDPGLAVLLHVKGQDLAYVGRFDEALAALERCTQIAASPSLCLGDEIFVRVHRNECAEVGKLARRWQIADAEAPDPYFWLANAAVADGQPAEAVHELLLQMEQRAPEEWRGVYTLENRWSEAVLVGEFDQARKAGVDAEAAVATWPDRASHATQRAVLTEIARETGKIDEAGRLADDVLRRSSSWLDDPRSEDWAIGKDLDPYFLDVLVEAGMLSKQQHAARLDAWLRGWRTRALPFFHPFLWLNAYGGLVRDDDTAREALAAMPEAGVPPFYMNVAPDGGTGRMFLVSGRVQEALPYLRRAAQGCFALGSPFAYVQSAIPLGDALERTGDHAGACRAYQSVVYRWGKAKPRSVTAERARARLKATGCA